jgi:hypothetical protein
MALINNIVKFNNFGLCVFIVQNVAHLRMTRIYKSGLNLFILYVYVI